MDIRIISGTPGIDRAQVVKRIAKAIERSGESSENASRKVCVACVEDELQQVVPAGDYTQNPALDPLSCILSQVPQDRVREHWKTAFNNTLASVTSGEPDLAIIVACLSYYRKETYEFYSPVDIQLLTREVGGCKPASVGILTLIDDIFDLYYRLSKKGHVFHQPEPGVGLQEDALVSQTALYKKAMKGVLRDLVRILEWRENEIQAAAVLGSALAISPATLAVKHPIETGVRLLLGHASDRFGLGRSFPVYLSHPISDPRRVNCTTGSWPDFVQEFMDFVNYVRAASHEDIHLVPIMPTAIDEFRFLKDGDRTLPWLSPRWPLPEGDLLYGAIEDGESYEDHEGRMRHRIFDPPVSGPSGASLPVGDDQVSGMIKGDGELSGMLMTLESLIQLQLANRDHMLVRQCPGFLMYRPTHGKEPRFTGGVKAEIRDQHQLRKFEEVAKTFERPIVAVHSKNDLKKFFAPESEFTVSAIDEVKRAADELHKAQTRILQGRLTKESASSALANPTAQPEVEQIYNELFFGEGGPISEVSQIPLAQAEVPLRASVLYARAWLLCGGRLEEDWAWQYVYLPRPSSQDETSSYSPTPDIPPTILVVVADDLENDAGARVAAAKSVVTSFCERMLHSIR